MEKLKGLNIKLPRNYVLTSDQFNYILSKAQKQKSGKHKGEKVLKQIACCSNIENIFKKLIEHNIKTGVEINTMKDFIGEVQKLVAEISKIIPTIGV